MVDASNGIINLDSKLYYHVSYSLLSCYKYVGNIIKMIGYLFDIYNVTIEIDKFKGPLQVYRNIKKKDYEYDEEITSSKRNEYIQFLNLYKNILPISDDKNILEFKRWSSVVIFCSKNYTVIGKRVIEAVINDKNLFPKIFSVIKDKTYSLEAEGKDIKPYINSQLVHLENEIDDNLEAIEFVLSVINPSYLIYDELSSINSFIAFMLTFK
jgi:hypothetical protein